MLQIAILARFADQETNGIRPRRLARAEAIADAGDTVEDRSACEGRERGEQGRGGRRRQLTRVTA